MAGRLRVSGTAPNSGTAPSTLACSASADPFYVDTSARPAQLEFGVLRPDRTFWVELFEIPKRRVKRCTDRPRSDTRALNPLPESSCGMTPHYQLPPALPDLQRTSYREPRYAHASNQAGRSRTAAKSILSTTGLFCYWIATIGPKTRGNGANQEKHAATSTSLF